MSALALVVLVIFALVLVAAGIGLAATGLHNERVALGRKGFRRPPSAGWR